MERTGRDFFVISDELTNLTDTSPILFEEPQLPQSEEQQPQQPGKSNPIVVPPVTHPARPKVDPEKQKPNVPAQPPPGRRPGRSSGSLAISAVFGQAA